MSNSNPSAFYSPPSSIDLDRNPSAKEGSSSPEDVGREYGEADETMNTPVYAANDYGVGCTVSTMAVEDKSQKQSQLLRYRVECITGTGSFGTVYQAKCLETKKYVAIKKVQQNSRYKSRELKLLQNMNHPNTVPLDSYFYTMRNDKLYLNLIMEYLPESLHTIAWGYQSMNFLMPIIYVKLYMHQLFRALAYLHSGLGVCHRDVKPRNLLINPQTHQLKLCDFGSAKSLVVGEKNVSTIGSRRYRAPELLYGAIFYTTAVDMWSAGCVLAGLLLGERLFDGEEEMTDQIAEILGAPTPLELQGMNLAATTEISGQNITRPWDQVLDDNTIPDAIDLVRKLIQYNPTLRGTALEACAHPFFDELRRPYACLPDRRPFPPLFDFQRELTDAPPELVRRLIPSHMLNGSGPEVPTSPPSILDSFDDGCFDDW